MSAEKCPNCQYVLSEDINNCPACGYDVRTVIKLGQLRGPALRQGGMMACVASGLTSLFMTDSVTVILISAGAGYLLGVIFTYISLSLSKTMAILRIGTAEQSAWYGTILVIGSGVAAGAVIARLIKIP